MVDERFKKGKPMTSGDTLSKLSDEDQIGSIVRPFFQGIDNEFTHMYKEADNLKKLIEIYGSKDQEELTKTEKWMFNAARANTTSKIITGLERILIRISIEVDDHHPADTMAGKRDMLDRLSNEMPLPGPLGHRSAVINDNTKEIMIELLKFRRAQRGCYTAQLVHLDLKGAAEQVLAVVSIVKSEVDQFKISLARQEYF